MDASLATLYLDHIGGIRRFLARRVACIDTAAELAHEAFVRFLAADNRPAIDNQRAFLYRIAENLAVDHFRKRSPLDGARVDIADCVDLATETPSPERYAVARQQVEQLRQAIAELPPRCREVFLRHKFDGLPQKSLAAEYGVTLNAIEKLLVRALVHLRLRVVLE